MSKKEAILQAATTLFAHKGYKGTATSEIAELAGVAQGTVFHHFKSKENLLISICDGLVQAYISGIKEAADGPGSGWQALERLLRFNEKFKQKHHDAITVVFRETRDLSKAEGQVQEHFCGLVNQIVEVKARCIEKGIDDGSIRPVPVGTTALFIHFLLVGRFHIETEGLLQVPEIDTDLIAFCRRSLAVEEVSALESKESWGG